MVVVGAAAVAVAAVTIAAAEFGVSVAGVGVAVVVAVFEFAVVICVDNLGRGGAVERTGTRISGVSENKRDSGNRSATN